MLDDAIDLGREAPHLQRDRLALLRELDALEHDRPDGWVRVAVERALRHVEAPWLAVIALHLAADAQDDPRIARVLDATSVRIIACALESPTIDRLERALLEKSLASAHLSVAEECMRLGERIGVDAHLEAATTSVRALEPGPYRDSIEHGIGVLRRRAMGEGPDHVDDGGRRA